jgi:hypothetical protein
LQFTYSFRTDSPDHTGKEGEEGVTFLRTRYGTKVELSAAEMDALKELVKRKLRDPTCEYAHVILLSGA